MHAHRRRRGLVLNLGSFAGQFPTPLLATYSASKSFLLSFSQALGAEQKGAKTGVDVIALNTYFVVSAMSKVRRASWMIPTPKQYVSRVLQKVNCKGGAGARPYSATLWPGHAVVDWVISNLLPSENWLLNYSYGELKKGRESCGCGHVIVSLLTLLVLPQVNPCPRASAQSRRQRGQQRHSKESAGLGGAGDKRLVLQVIESR